MKTKEQAIKEKPQGGLHGFEQEWNLLDEDLRPLLTVGAGPSRQSFVDYLRAECIPPWQRQFSQLEVFHWMVEWATRPYYSPRGAVYETRLMEASLINALHCAGLNFGERLHYWHGNLLFLDLRDHYGIAQCVIDVSSPLFAEVDQVRLETVVAVEGQVLARSAETVNPELATGGVELRIEKIEILSRAEALPLQVNSDQDYGEEVRLKYRFLDLRREKRYANGHNPMAAPVAKLEEKLLKNRQETNDLLRELVDRMPQPRRTR